MAPAEAVAQSLQALRWLQAQGARQIYLKYCSTFGSTPADNIGPVTEALMEALGCDFTITAASGQPAGSVIHTHSTSLVACSLKAFEAKGSLDGEADLLPRHTS